MALLLYLRIRLADVSITRSRQLSSPGNIPLQIDVVIFGPQVFIALSQLQCCFHVHASKNCPQPTPAAPTASANEGEKKKKKKKKAAVDTADGPALPAKVARQIEKINRQAPDITAALKHTVDHSGALPVAERAIMVDECLDAIGGLRAAVTAAGRQLASKVAANKARGGTDGYQTEPLEAQAVAAKEALATGLAAFEAMEFGTVGATGLGELEAGALERIPLASTDTAASAGYTVSSTDGAGVAGANLQRVVGHLSVLESRAAAAGDAAAATAKVDAAVAVYTRRVVAAAPALAGQILDDVASYEKAMARLTAQPGGQAGLERLKAAQGRLATQEPLTMAAAEALVAGSSPGRPDPTKPAAALYGRQQATAGSIALYKQLCALIAALDIFASVVPGAVKALPRYTFKVLQKYGGNFGLCKDLIRATIEVGSLADVATVVEALYRSGAIRVVRAKDRFNASAEEALPIGGYRVRSPGSGGGGLIDV